LDVPPMICSVNPTLAEQDMLTATLLNAPRNLAMSLDHAIPIAASASRASRQFAPAQLICT
jgi:hypothetical protein